MSIQAIVVVHNGQAYRFEPITGSLLSEDAEKRPKHLTELPDRVKLALDLNDEPYTLRPFNPPDTEHVKVPIWLRIHARLMVLTCRFSFSLGRMLASLRLPVHANAKEAIIAFRNMFPGEAQKELCLPRSLYAVATSREFRNSGVVFIGVFLPSRSMHAWVIEDGQQADPFDGVWLNQRPVAVIY